MRLVEEAGVAAIALHPRSAAVRHQGRPDYGLVRELVERLAGTEARVIVSGGLASAAGRAARLRGVGRRRGDDRPGRAGEPVDLRGADAARRRDAAEPARRSSRSCCGRWIAPRSTWAPSARRATRASSTRGTWSGSASAGPRRDAFQRTESLDRGARGCWARQARPARRRARDGRRWAEPSDALRGGFLTAKPPRYNRPPARVRERRRRRASGVCFGSEGAPDRSREGDPHETRRGRSTWLVNH